MLNKITILKVTIYNYLTMTLFKFILFEICCLTLKRCKEQINKWYMTAS